MGAFCDSVRVTRQALFGLSANPLPPSAKGTSRQGLLSLYPRINEKKWLRASAYARLLTMTSWGLEQEQRQGHFRSVPKVRDSLFLGQSPNPTLGSVLSHNWLVSECCVEAKLRQDNLGRFPNPA